MRGLGGAGEGGVGDEGHVLVLLSSQQLNRYLALHVMWLPRACNVVTVTLESNVDKQMFSWQSDICTVGTENMFPF